MEDEHNHLSIRRFLQQFPELGSVFDVEKHFVTEALRSVAFCHTLGMEFDFKVNTKSIPMSARTMRTKSTANIVFS